MEDISGMEFVVQENKVMGEGIKIMEDEWLPAVLVAFDNADYTYNKQLIKQIRWNFELQGPEYAWKAEDGRTGQFKTSKNTSLSCSPKSNLYKLYSKLMGREPLVGEKISLKNLLNVPCYVMVKVTKGKDKEGNEKDYYNVDKVKLREGGQKPVSQPPVQQSAQQPAPIRQASLQPVQKPGEVKKEPDIFEDVFV